MSKEHRQHRQKILHRLVFPNGNLLPKIAVTHPGKMGDAIYALPAIRWLCALHDVQADFWTSSYCAPLKELFEAQSCIDKLIVSPSYQMAHCGCGAQPWYVPIPEEFCYFQTYQLGFRGLPFYPLHNYIASLAGAPQNLPVQYDYVDKPTLEEKYIVVAPRGESKFVPFIAKALKFVQVVQVGAKNDKVSNLGVDCTGLNFLDTLPWIAKAKAFVGCMSSQLVLAEGFAIPRFGSIPDITAINNIVNFDEQRRRLDLLQKFEQRRRLDLLQKLNQ